MIEPLGPPGLMRLTSETATAEVRPRSVASVLWGAVGVGRGGCETGGCGAARRKCAVGVGPGVASVLWGAVGGGRVHVERGECGAGHRKCAVGRGRCGVGRVWRWVDLGWGEPSVLWRGERYKRLGGWDRHGWVGKYAVGWMVKGTGSVGRW
eukprot:90688-Chlamydomonas_euryale.AAC.1